MPQELQALEKELIAAHQDLETVTKRVEELESRKDYLLLGDSGVSDPGSSSNN